MKLSIVIPVYNVEETLRTCVESAVVSSFDDWEMILVDDGSTDGSGCVCNQLAQENRHIRVIHKANGGLSDARNYGIEMATGQYLAFADSDDAFHPGTLEHVLAVMEEHPNYDILEFPVSVDHGGSKEHRLTFTDRAYTNVAEYWIRAEAYRHAYAWNKIYRSELFSQCRYPVGRLFEDVHILPSLLRQARTVGTTSEGLYYYNYNPHGITHTADGRALNDLLEAHMQILQNEMWLWEGQDIEDYYAHVLNIQIDVYERMGRPPVLPLMPFHGTLKLKLLHLMGMKKLCQCSKIWHQMVSPS